jgi:superfamily II DNA or RNA helicase
MGADATGWEQVGAGAPLRAYQRRAVGELLQALEEPGSRACLVAPPGAGKTRCALVVAAELALPVEVRVPTTALVQQWRERLERIFVSLGDGPAAPPIRVGTYAGLGELSPGALVILDEAHHLGAAWGRELIQRLSDDHRVLGLTATPPHDSPGWNLFLELVGAEPVRVETPPLVRDGHLSPYQDLVWPVLSDLDDLPELREVHRGLQEAERGVADELGLWVSQRLREDLWELTEARFSKREGLLVALCRHQHARGFDLPHDLPRDPELLVSPTLHDRALLLWRFGRDRPALRRAVEAAGFRARGRGLVLQEDVCWRSLAASEARVRGCLDLLASEHSARADGLRALVLTSRDVDGGPLGARQVLRALVSDARTDPLDPILVTGKVFWVDDDLWPRICDRLPPLLWRRAGDHHEVDVSTWSVADRVGLATRLLGDGICRCLVGTHHLLGEGWDCPAVNCLVDLTGIVSAVTVNQVRGRALRPDPEDPSKVASLWEVLTLAPGAAGGERMLEKARERHRHTFGVDDRGRIRAGIARIDPRLELGLEAVVQQIPQLRAHMEQRARETQAVAGRWAVGRGYRDQREWRVEARPVPRARGTRHRPEKPIAAQPGSLARLQRRRSWGARALAGGGLVAGAAAAWGGLSLLGPPGLLLGGVGVAAGLGLSALVAFTGGGARRRRRAQLEALVGAMRGLDPQIGELVIEGDEVRVEGPSESGRRFAEAVAELLGPVRYPRYLLLEPDGRVWPVPGELGARRDLADRFCEAWAEHVGAAEVLFARQGRGRVLLEAAWRLGGRDEVSVVESWT